MNTHGVAPSVREHNELLAEVERLREAFGQLQKERFDECARLGITITRLREERGAMETALGELHRQLTLCENRIELCEASRDRLAYALREIQQVRQDDGPAGQLLRSIWIIAEKALFSPPVREDAGVSLIWAEEDRPEHFKRRSE